MLIGRLDSALHQDGGAIDAVFRANAHRATARSDDNLRATALGAYLVMRLVTRTLELAGGSDESLTLQQVSTARFVDDLPTTMTECVHLRLVLAGLATDAGGRSWPRLRIMLLRYAGWLEREGRLDLALEALRLAARTWRGEIPPAEFTALALTVGRVNRQLARLRLAEDAYAAAQDGAVATDDRLGQLRARLGTVSVRRLQGDLRGLDAELAAALAACRQDDTLAPLLPLVHAEIGALCTAAGRASDAIRSMVRAARAATTELERLQVLLGLGRILLETGRLPAARLMLEHVASSADDRLLRASADLELMDLASAEGDRLAFERVRIGLDRFMWRLPATTRADFHYRCGLGLSRFAQFARAARSWAAGRELAIDEGLSDWDDIFFRLQGSLGGCRDVVVERDAPASAELDALLEDVRSLILPSGPTTFPAGAGTT